MKRPHQNGSKTKFIVVTGGVISGLGKGIVTASIGNLLAARGFSVTAIKIDPYLNFDAGTMRPTEHGEVFVTFDGGETDQDLGTYERFLDTKLSRIHNLTSGQVWWNVLQRERNLEYNGKTVQPIPHVPEEIIRRIREIEKNTATDFVLIEIGGVIGDYENLLFIEAVKQMYLKGDAMAFIHVVFLPVPHNLGEMKTKPAQHSVRALNELGIFPDFLIARAPDPIDEPRKEKLSAFTNVPLDAIISAPDLDTVYAEPLIFEEQRFSQKLLQHFDIEPAKSDYLNGWKRFVETIRTVSVVRKIGIVGKYFDSGDFTLEDSYVSVIESIKHAAWKHGFKPEIKWIDAKQFEKDPASVQKLAEFDGIIVPGGFGASGIEGKINAIRYCRENRKPFLGLCYGLQLAVVEYARNVCHMIGAHTTEINPNTTYPVIDVMTDQKELIEHKKLGGTMRLGEYDAALTPGTRVYRLYGSKPVIRERHRHRFEVNPRYEKQLSDAGLVFSGKNPQRNLVEFIELADHPFFVATQAHPEFTSRPLSPNPLFDGFVAAMK
ncbi:MAG: CTP synthase [Candidatus Diapherotrites archaeon]|nr:CTP synthase [Candidatus Diapherotrites archaeon]